MYTLCLKSFSFKKLIYRKFRDFFGFFSLYLVKTKVKKVKIHIITDTKRNINRVKIFISIMVEDVVSFLGLVYLAKFYKKFFK